MENSIAIKQINLVNFKGLRNQTINFNHITNIFGDNGIGKTTIFDAFTWLLFGKDSTDRTNFEIKTLDKNNNVIPKIEHEVSGIININGEEISVKKILKEKWVKKRGSLDAEFSGNETLYFWNDVPKTQREYQEKIAELLDESVFKMITNPLAFNLLKWKDRRNVLIDIVGNVSNEVIAGTNDEFKNLLEKLTNKSLDDYKKQMASQRKKINDSLKSIPTRIDEVSRNTQAALDFTKLKNDKAVSDKELESIQSQIDDKTKAFDKILEARNIASSEIFELKSKLQNIEFETKQSIGNSIKIDASGLDDLNRGLTNKENELKSYENGLNSLNLELKALENKVVSFKNKIINKRSDWETENAKELNFDDSKFACPTCKRDFEASDVETKKAELIQEFDINKNNALNTINKEGKLLTEQKEAAEKEILGLKERISNGDNSIKSVILEIENIKSKIEHCKNTGDAEEVKDPSELLKTALRNNAEYQQIIKDTSVKENDLKEAPIVDVEELKLKKLAVTSKISEINSQLLIEVQIANSNKRVKELEDQESDLAQQLSDIEREQFTIENFIKKKVYTLESLINDKFHFVKFKLFETQVNGAQIECCHALIDGVPFSDANTASKINAGLDIINTLCEYYKITAPIFIDNRESIVNIIDCNSQIVNLIVSKPDKTLRVA